MRHLYNFGIFIYTLAINIAALRNPKARLWVSGRKARPLPLTERPVWMHCASLGEFEQGRPVLEMLGEQHPEIKILLTFFSPSGYEVRKSYQGADLVCYLPADTPGNVKRFLDTHNPRLAVFVKYEIWHNYIASLQKRSIPVFLIASKFRKDQVYFKPWGTWFTKTLMKFNHIFTQDEESRNLLSSVRVNSILAGDTRFDRVIAVSGGWKELSVADDFIKESKVLVAGSTWPADEEMLRDYLDANGEKYNLKLIVAPHETDNSHIGALQQKFRNAVLFSDWKQDSGAHNVLIIDKIGILNRLYHYGDICYIGGGFGAGIHNTLEAAVYGKPVLFGPKYEKFKEAVDLIGCGAGISVGNYHEFESAMNHWLESPEQMKRAGQSARQLVFANSGATKTIVTSINSFLK